MDSVESPKTPVTPKSASSISDERSRPVWKRHRRRYTTTAILFHLSTASPFVPDLASTPVTFLSPDITPTWTDSASNTSEAAPKMTAFQSAAAPQRASWLLRSKKRQSKLSPAFLRRLDRLRIPIMPLYPFPAGPPHLAFPVSLLAFHLLTEPEMDAIAAYYHQSTPSHPYKHLYPCPVQWDVDFLTQPTESMCKEERELCISDEERLRFKRRMIGRFVGISGCETPVVEVERRVKWYADRIEMLVKRAARLKELSERKDFCRRGGW